MILILILYAVFSAMTFINSAIMLNNPYPFFIGMLRAWISSGVMFGISFAFYREELKNFTLSRSAWKKLIIFGITVHGLVMSGFSFCVQYIEPTKVCFIFATCPFITALLQQIMREETITRKKLMGLVVGFLGLMPILFQGEHGAYQKVPAHLEFLGSIVCFALIVTFAYGWVVMKRFLRRNQAPQIIVNSYAMLIGGIVSFALFVASCGLQGFGNMTFTSNFYPLVTAFVAASLLTYVLYPYLLKQYSATFLAFAGFLEPVFALIFSALYLKQPITISSLLSLCVLFLGLYLFYREELAPA